MPSDAALFGVFENLGTATGSGSLRLDDDTSERCVAACDELIVELERCRRHVRGSDWRAQFGDFQAGKQLADRYALLATGSDASFDRVLRGHIDVVVRMREVFEATGSAYREAEVQNVAAFGSVGESLGG